MKRALVAAVFLSALLAQSGHDVRADFVCSSSVLNVCSGGGGGASGITSGTTTITGGTDTHVCFNDAGVMSCGDTGLTFTKATDKLSLAGPLEIGHATDTTLSRSAAGWLDLEGAVIPKGNTQQITFAGPTQARTYTFPDAAETVATLGQTQTFTGGKTFNAQIVAAGGIQASGGTTAINSEVVLNMGTGGGLGGFQYSTTSTPDLPFWFTGVTGNAVHIAEIGDEDYDSNNGPCGTAACINPQVVVHDADQNVTNYQSLGLSGLSGGFRVTLADGVATSIVTLAVPAATSVSGQLLYTVHARDATNAQTRSGRIIWNAVAEGTNSTCVLGTAEELDNTPTGTLTAAITCDDASNNSIALQINAASSLTETTLEAYGTMIVVGSGEALPQ